MSILNAILAGKSEDSFKTATPISVASSSIQFATGGMPSEYILMLANDYSESIDSSNHVGLICDTNIYDRLFNALNASINTTYKNASISYVTASYSAGVFTLTTTGTGSNHGYFYTSTDYILFYR